VSTASLYCGNHGQRLQERGTNAPFTSGSFGLDPRALRSERLRWLNNLSGKLTVPPALFRKVSQLFGRGRWTPCDLRLCKNEPEYKIAAFLKFRQRFSGKPDSFPGVGGCQALSHTTQTHHHLCIGRLEARTGASPPPSSTPQHPRAPP
jgi:hypothetical protein